MKFVLILLQEDNTWILGWNYKQNINTYSTFEYFLNEMPNKFIKLDIDEFMRTSVIQEIKVL